MVNIWIGTQPMVFQFMMEQNLKIYYKNDGLNHVKYK